MLIVYAHPHTDGHCGFLLAQVQQKLTAAHCPFELIDLYAMKFNPVLQKEELFVTHKNNIAPDVHTLQEKIKQHDSFVFIYPTWWNGTPAILKGFFDRVLTSGFAFQYVKNIPRGLLQGKKAIVMTTTGGPSFFQKLLVGNRSLMTVAHDTIAFCGIKTKGFLIGSARILTEKKKKKMTSVVEKAVRWLVSMR